MTKADIVEKVYDNLGGLSKKESAEIVELVFETIKNDPRARREDQDQRLRQLRRPTEERARRSQPADGRRDQDRAAKRADLQAVSSAQERHQPLSSAVSRVLSLPPIPDKHFFKIGEVAELVGVRTTVLRFWESEFTQIRPTKTPNGHRVYARTDVELLRRIRVLVHDRGYTIAGARSLLQQGEAAVVAVLDAEPLRGRPRAECG
jgi:hypothetical protein